MFTLTIETGSARYPDDIAAMLNRLARALEGTVGAQSGHLRDDNGNTVGIWCFDPASETAATEDKTRAAGSTVHVVVHDDEAYVFASEDDAARFAEAHRTDHGYIELAPEVQETTVLSGEKAVNVITEAEEN